MISACDSAASFKNEEEERLRREAIERLQKLRGAAETEVENLRQALKEAREKRVKIQFEEVGLVFQSRKRKETPSRVVSRKKLRSSAAACKRCKPLLLAACLARVLFLQALIGICRSSLAQRTVAKAAQAQVEACKEADVESAALAVTRTYEQHLLSLEVEGRLAREAAQTAASQQVAAADAVFKRQLANSRSRKAELHDRAEKDAADREASFECLRKSTSQASVFSSERRTTSARGEKRRLLRVIAEEREAFEFLQHLEKLREKFQRSSEQLEGQCAAELKVQKSLPSQIHDNYNYEQSLHDGAAVVGLCSLSSRVWI